MAHLSLGLLAFGEQQQVCEQEGMQLSCWPPPPVQQPQRSLEQQLALLGDQCLPTRLLTQQVCQALGTQERGGVTPHCSCHGCGYYGYLWDVGLRVDGCHGWPH